MKIILRKWNSFGKWRLFQIFPFYSKLFHFIPNYPFFSKLFNFIPNYINARSLVKWSLIYLQLNRKYCHNFRSWMYWVQLQHRKIFDFLVGKLLMAMLQKHSFCWGPNQNRIWSPIDWIFECPLCHRQMILVHCPHMLLLLHLKKYFNIVFIKF